MASPVEVAALQSKVIALKAKTAKGPAELAEAAALKAEHDKQKSEEVAKKAAKKSAREEAEADLHIATLSTVETELNAIMATPAAPGATPAAAPGAAPAAAAGKFETAIKTVSDFMEKVGNKITSGFETASMGTLKFIHTILKFLKWDDVASLLGDFIEPRELRARLESGLTKGQKVKKSSDDAGQLKVLRAQYKAFVDAAKDGTPEKSMTVDTFIQERIKEVDNTTAANAEISLKNLVDARIPQEKAADALKNDKEVQAFQKAGFVEQADKSWVNDKLDLGEDPKNPGTKITSVTFKKNAADNRWEWTNNSKEAVGMLAAGKMLGNERFDNNGASTDDQKRLRAEMNALADTLGVKSAPAPTTAPSGTPTVTPEQKQERIKNNPEAKKAAYIASIGKALQDMGVTVAGYDQKELDTDMEGKRTDAYRYKTVAENLQNWFETNAPESVLGVEVDGGDLEETDGSNMFTDNDIMTNFDLKNNPISTIDRFLSQIVMGGTNELKDGTNINGTAYTQLPILQEKIKAELKKYIG